MVVSWWKETELQEMSVESPCVYVIMGGLKVVSVGSG